MTATTNAPSDNSYESFRAKVLEGKGLKANSPEDVGYRRDYGTILAWFKAQDAWTADLVRIGSLVVYGWMPTILRSSRMSNFDQFASRLNDGKLEDNDHRFVNNSYVGTSKFLHFWDPKKFAIWDRNVAKVLAWGSLVNEKTIFDLYQQYCRRFASDEKWSLRRIEQSLFLQSRKKV